MKKNDRLIWRIFPYHALIVMLAFLMIFLHASASFRSYYVESSRADLLAKAELLGEAVIARGVISSPARLDSLCKEMGRIVSTRFTVVLPSGLVIGDSMHDPRTMANHGDRPEIRDALAGRPGAKTRNSFTLGQPMMYVATPVRANGRIAAVVRASFLSRDMGHTLKAFYFRLFFGGLILATLALAFSVIISLRLNRVFHAIRVGAARFSAGDLSHRFHITSFAEIEDLAEAMNGMAEQLSRRIETITSQRNELEAVLSSMTEAVIAVDADERIIKCNHAAEFLLGVALDSVRGRTMQETIRNSRIQAFIKRVLAGGPSVSEDDELPFPPERTLQAHGTLLRDAGNRSIGALIVLTDVTRLKTLENVRRDFVANVSHELKTPITSIKGFVETLRDGAIEDREAALRFLDIILRHADRLNAIIDDLLSLSRIEQESETGSVQFERVAASEVLKNVLLVCEGKSREKTISLDTSADDGLSFRGNAALVEQAVVNLVDNAIKYSAPGSRVSLGISREGNEAVIRVGDHGIGIPEKHLVRIFERFYRVDRARSRDMGGTGLGLSIVKHIVQAYGGRITVTSTPGEGSVFTLFFPVEE